MYSFAGLRDLLLDQKQTVNEISLFFKLKSSFCEFVHSNKDGMGEEKDNLWIPHKFFSHHTRNFFIPQIF
jgi:hypothetical protein